MTDHAVCHPLAANESLREALEESTSTSTNSTTLLDVSSSGKKGKKSPLTTEVDGQGQGQGQEECSSGGLTAIMEVSKPQ